MSRQPDFSIVDVGHGNAALVVDEAVVTLIDAACGRTVVEALRERGVTTIHRIVISHADADHYAGVQTILLDQTLRVNEVVVNPDASKDSESWREFRVALADAMSRSRLRVTTSLNTAVNITSGHTKFTIEVLSPTPAVALGGPGGKDLKGRRMTSNSSSVVLRILHESVPVALLPGDIDGTGLDNLLEVCPKPVAKLLVFPHHGGRPGNAAPAEFARRLCAAVQPEAVVFSIGRGIHGTPRPEIIQAIRQTLPSAHIICTQLSTHCAATLPTAHAHLSSRVAKGRNPKGNSCCGGTVVIDAKALAALAEPTWSAHRNFVQSLVPGRICQ
jgi:beta-lactamase superfamily II metal-dependent hydrolase